MNLLIFIHSMNAGGAERVTANLANHWADKGWRVTVVTLTSTAQDFYQLHPAVNCIALDVAGESANTINAIINNLLRIRALRHVLKQVRPDIVLAMMITANIFRATFLAMIAASNFIVKTTLNVALVPSLGINRIILATVGR